MLRRSILLVLLLVFPALAVGEEPPALSLADALLRTLKSSKALSAYDSELRSYDAKLIQAATLPNPELEVTPENLSGKRFFRDQFQNTVQVSQLIELGGKRSGRISLATSEREGATLDYTRKRNDLLIETNLRFVEVLADQESLLLARRACALAADALTRVRSRVLAGQSAALEEPRARVLVANSRIREEHAEHELSTARRSLAALWGEKELDFSKVSGKLFGPVELPPFEELARRLSSAPEKQRAENTRRLRRARSALEEAKRVPDVRFGVGWRHGRSLDDQTMLATFSVPLPLFDRNEGGIAEAKALEEESVFLDESLGVQLESALFALYQEMRHAQGELSTMVREIIPQSERAVRLAEQGLSEGRTSFFDLAQTQRELIESHGAQIEAARNFHRLSLDVEKLLGGPAHAE